MPYKVVEERIRNREERKAAAKAKQEANWQKRYDKANPKQQERMTARKEKRDARIAAREERRAQNQGLKEDMIIKRQQGIYTDDDKAFFIANAKMRNMPLKEYYAKYVK